MERGRKMDAAGTASKPIALIPAFVFLFFLSFAAQAVAQTSDRALLERLRQLTAQQNWQEVIILAESARSPSADLDFYYGTALAQEGRWEDAQRAFAAGARLQPGDKRFPLELAGVAFKQKTVSGRGAPPAAGLASRPHRCVRQRFSWHRLFSAGEHRGCTEVLEPGWQAANC